LTKKVDTENEYRISSYQYKQICHRMLICILYIIICSLRRKFAECTSPRVFGQQDA
jgi:hypothetical protein